MNNPFRIRNSIELTDALHEFDQHRFGVFSLDVQYLYFVGVISTSNCGRGHMDTCGKAHITPFVFHYK